MAPQISLQVSSLNSRGFNIPEKRRQILYHFHKLRTQILLLQETHFRSNAVPLLLHKHYPIWFHRNNPSTKSKGFSIAFHASFTPDVLDSVIDPLSRYILLKLSYMQSIFTIVNVYSPNQDQQRFLSSVTSHLKRFGAVNVILGGDLNAALIPRLDSSTGKSSVSPASLTKMNLLFSELSLVDVWRVLNPSNRDYTYYSPAHSSYSCIDYILILQSLLDYSPVTSIGLKLWSDYTSIRMSLEQIPIHKKRFSWRRNNNLLSDSVCFQDIINTIRDFVKDHAHNDTNPLTKWDALKCVLRGKFIQHGSRLKRARTSDILHLLAKITSLEGSHKCSLDPTTLLDLSNTRRYLLRILTEHSLVARDKGRFTHYYLPKLSLYADDLLLYVTQPHISIPSILSEIHRFGLFSNYKLNLSKTEALNLSLPQPTLPSPQTSFSFQWQSKSISYLGTAILSYTGCICPEL